MYRSQASLTSGDAEAGRTGGRGAYGARPRHRV